MDTSEKIKKLAVETLELNEEVFAPDVTLESLGLDSLEKIDFIFALEDEFKIKIPNIDVTACTLKDIADIIEKLVAEQHGNALGAKG